MIKVFTIGYGGWSKEEFLFLLKSNIINTLVYIRLRPDKSGIGFYAKAKTADKGIEGWLSEAGIKYKSLTYRNWKKSVLNIMKKKIQKKLRKIIQQIFRSGTEKREHIELFCSELVKQNSEPDDIEF
jgi:hypothetical protein